MTPERIVSPRKLPNAPRDVSDEQGHPRFGTFSGEVAEVDFNKLAGPYAMSKAWRAVKHKSWQYTFVATPEVIALCAIADLRYTGNAFVVAVDLASRKLLHDGSFLGAPGLQSVSNYPGQGLQARFRTLGAKFWTGRKEGSGRYELDVQVSSLLGGGLSWKGDVLAENGPPALTVIAPVGNGGVVNVTQKWAGLLASGKLTAAGRTYDLDGGVAGMDYTNGLLARNTSWRWAFACGRLPDGTPLGLNLVEGFNEDNPNANENGLWLGNELIPLDRARFSFNPKDPLDTWRVETVDGSVKLKFQPIYVHREHRDYLLVKSRFIQPVGLFEGTIRANGRTLEVKALAGVTEDQDMLW